MKTILASIALLGAIVLHTQAAPANDLFANRIALPSQAVVRFTGSLVGATNEFGDPDPHSRGTVWYQWTADQSGRVAMSSVGGVIVYIHVGGDLLTGKYLGPKAAERFYAIAGQSYNICVWTGNTIGPFEIGLVNDGSVSPLTEFVFPLANDDFSQPLELSESTPRWVQYTHGATLEPFEDELRIRADLPRPRGGGVWIQWTAPLTGQATFVARAINLADVGVLAGRGGSIESLSIKATGKNLVTFRCVQGRAYRLYIASPSSTQVLARIKAR